MGVYDFDVTSCDIGVTSCDHYEPVTCSSWLFKQPFTAERCHNVNLTVAADLGNGPMACFILAAHSYTTHYQCIIQLYSHIFKW